ncbi:MAG: thioredoxin domain-containing protein [Euryarchaeota archaeon]|nr:thioredoxin domain-containing protein [Euryarchaeota archaeon]
MSANRLAEEKSPYLLQHSKNPVDWYPWGEEAFERARKEDKPVLLSIGYSTCHWCHVMAHESFEDAEVAGLLNEGFVSVKVDREERPDIDGVYMSVCQMMSGNCGWPLTIFLTPEKRPFMAATYIPRSARSGQPGMLELLPNITKVWKERRTEITGLADGIQAAMRRRTEEPRAPGPDERSLAAAHDMLSSRFDEAHGGFGDAPKFPAPHNLLFLLGRWKRTGEARALEMVERTLQAMRRGGVWDHVGGGFHRYSTDAEWFVPHFEKMLYDQAMLAIAYTSAFQATRKEAYASTARDILDYVLRDLGGPEGGFCSAEDADSEGVEGRFYLWTAGELDGVLGPDDAALAGRVFGATKAGNFCEEATGKRDGRNLLHLKAELEDIAGVLELEPTAFERRLQTVLGKLLEAREKRARPHRDDKVLADWNGLIVAALARAAVVLGRDRYGKAARKAADFVEKRMRRDGRLLHRFRDGDASFAGNLEDHAFMVWGLLELYDWDHDPSHLEAALELNGLMLGHFWDGEGGGLFFTPDDGEELLIRQKEAYDGAIPAGNSVAAMNLLRLGLLTGDPKLAERGREVVRAFSADMESLPAAHTHLMSALALSLGPTREVVIAGEPEAEDTAAMLKALRAEFLPDLVVLLKPPGEKGEALAKLAPFTKDMKMHDGKATAYVCTGGTCKQPVTEPGTMLALLK